MTDKSVPDITFYDEGFKATTMQVQWNTKMGACYMGLHLPAIGTTVKKSYGYELMRKCTSDGITYNTTETPLFE